MLRIVKIGGNIVDNPEALDKVIGDFAQLPGEKILVHGGGKIATSISNSLGINTEMIDGRRVTDSRTRDVVTMVYAGLINKTIVNKLNAAGAIAIGLSGADGRLIVSNRRDPHPIDYGFVGDPAQVNTNLLGTLLDMDLSVVVAPITTDTHDLLNTNADTVARALAVAMAADKQVELIYCFEKNGVQTDVNDPASVVPLIDRRTYGALRSQGIIADGMIPKLDNAFEAIESGVSRVVICNAANLLEQGYGGTSVVG